MSAGRPRARAARCGCRRARSSRRSALETPWSVLKPTCRSVVAGSAPADRSAGYLRNLTATVDMLRRTTPIRLAWAKDYSDYHPEEPGGAAAGRTCECRPLNSAILGEYRTRLRPGVMEAKIPMPTTTADYRWMNLSGAGSAEGHTDHCQAPRSRTRRTAAWPTLRRGRAGTGRRTIRWCCARGDPDLDRHRAATVDHRHRADHWRSRGPRRAQGHHHRTARCGVGGRRVRSQHGLCGGSSSPNPLAST